MNKEVLRRPFPTELVKHREGQGGKMLSYLETHVVIERLNEGCDAWSFEVVEHRVYKVEVVVVGKLTADGVVKMAFGGSAITINDAGKVVSLADDLKAAASDALKKAASMLGVGLELYARKSAALGRATEPRPGNAGRSQSPAGPQTAPPGDAATQKQISAIGGICRRKNVSHEHLVALIEQRTGKRQLRELTRRQASALLSELSGMNGTHPASAASAGP
jgi:hypothetical protein